MAKSKNISPEVTRIASEAEPQLSLEDFFSKIREACAIIDYSSQKATDTVNSVVTSALTYCEEFARIRARVPVLPGASRSRINRYIDRFDHLCSSLEDFWPRLQLIKFDIIIDRIRNRIFVTREEAEDALCQWMDDHPTLSPDPRGQPEPPPTPDLNRACLNAISTMNALFPSIPIFDGGILDFSSFRTIFEQTSKYAITADIRQMFRQIMHPDHQRDLLRILWRPEPHHPISEYRLTTVTYGTASAPFLACRVIAELANISQTTYPLASQALSGSTYVDDILLGGDSIEEAMATRKQIVELLDSAHLELRKWAANDTRLLEGLPRDHILPASQAVNLSFDNEKPVKVLGLVWNNISDDFSYKVSTSQRISTKRQLASQVGQLFDPLGWIVPVAVYARLLQREVIRLKLGWDEPLPEEICIRWAEFAKTLPLLETLSVPRHIPNARGPLWLVGFADASERAYAAVVYSITKAGDEYIPSLITARARIAPSKPETLPRLELLAATLLSATFQKLTKVFPCVDPSKRFAISDSTIALSWITANPPPSWKPFVGNHVSTILKSVGADRWFHVPSSQNPADLPSRGLSPQAICNNRSWWKGPQWLASDPDAWPISRVRAAMDDPQVLQEKRTKQFLNVSNEVPQLFPELEARYSSLSHLQSVVAWCLRFSNNTKNPQNRSSGPLSSVELRTALSTLVKRVQKLRLRSEIEDAQLEKPQLKITKKLGLFLDDNGILRVGGRLKYAQIPFDAKHPALLPQDSELTNLIINQAHEDCLH
ncbi:unnamed protein product, partial [Nesidiocoris tenuis]